VAASLSVAVVLAILYVAYDVALSRVRRCPAATCEPWRRRLHRPRPGHRQRRDSRSCRTHGVGVGGAQERLGAALGFAPPCPSAYLVMVVAVQIVRPILG
jgi:hypothetical protein